MNQIQKERKKEKTFITWSTCLFVVCLFVCLLILHLYIQANWPPNVINLPLETEPLLLEMSRYKLKQLWPFNVQTENWERDGTLTESFTIGEFDQTVQAFQVLRRPHFGDSSPATPYILIPRRYKNGVRLINAKISYIQQCARLLSAPAPKRTSKRGKENLQLALDSAVKILTINCLVRKIFFEDVNKTLYVGNALNDKGEQSVVSFPDDYSCPVMNDWLYYEFHCGHHDPKYLDKDWGNEESLFDREAHL